jgi:hypothetical protein
VKVDCAKPVAIVVHESDLFVACSDETLTYTTLTLEMSALMFRVAYSFCIDQPCDQLDKAVAFDVASLLTAVVGTIAGIAVAATWHDVKRRTTMIVPSVQFARGGMIGLRATF